MCVESAQTELGGVHTHTHTHSHSPPSSKK